MSEDRDPYGRWPQGVSGNLSGRPGILTPALVDQVTDRLRHGVSMEAAAALCGASKSSLFAWIRKGAAEWEAHDEDPDWQPSTYAQLSMAVECALSDWEAELLKCIRHAADDPRQWVAAAWLLERRLPHIYGRRNPEAALRVEIRQLVAIFAQKEGLDRAEVQGIVDGLLRDMRSGELRELPPP
jgi:hypothetical protein